MFNFSNFTPSASITCLLRKTKQAIEFVLFMAFAWFVCHESWQKLPLNFWKSPEIGRRHPFKNYAAVSVTSELDKSSEEEEYDHHGKVAHHDGQITYFSYIYKGFSKQKNMHENYLTVTK